jgi:UDP-N-acetylglucosamine--N-acetylmuramyl-(pentapeptide) pyrophosphoryl-undecaprenol N-acetylglucosamine transferase
MSVFVLVAGGTGGHLFPAMALAQELRRRGHDIHLMTDHRVSSYGEFPARDIHVVPSATPSLSNPVKFVQGGLTILGGTWTAWNVLRKIKPAAMVGFGGYPTFPPFVAASFLGIPGILHEANSVLGRANRALTRFADVLALGFANAKFSDSAKIEIVVTGNPVRDRVKEFTKAPYPALGPDDPINVVIFGGSQGARAFADIVPPAVALLGEDLRQRLRVVQQCRPEDLDRVAEAYRQAKVNVELAAFFADMPERIAEAHLIISRSGASTVAELGVIGRPAILIPLPGAIDADQRENARFVEAAGGGWIAEQATLSPLSLGTRLTELFNSPETLVRAAAKAVTLGQPDAVGKLADLAEKLAGNR